MCLMLLNCSCLSYMSADASRSEVNERRAIRAVQLEDGAGIGVDLLSLDTLGEHPIRQILAAIGDLGVLYGAYQGIQSLTSSSSKSSESGNSSDNGGTTVTVNGSGNTVNIGNTTTKNETTEPTETADTY